MTSTRALIARLTLVLALMIAMASSGLAHRFVPEQANETLTAYLAAGGSYADICGDVEQGAMQSCDACRLVDTACLAGVDPSSLSPNAYYGGTGFAQTHVEPSLPAFDPVRAVRAPPAT